MNKKTLSFILIAAALISAVTYRFYQRHLPLLDKSAEQEVLDEERKAAREALKRDYPESLWAKKASVWGG